MTLRQCLIYIGNINKQMSFYLTSTHIIAEIIYLSHILKCKTDCHKHALDTLNLYSLKLFINLTVVFNVSLKMYTTLK